MKAADKLPPEAFLEPEKFLRTPHDTPKADAEAKKRGLEVGHNASEFHIAINSIWSAHMKDNGHMQSYECLGYHQSTASFMRGILESGVSVYVHRWNEKHITHTKIQ